MVDCVVRLDHEVVDLVSQRKLRIVKYRGSSFYENESPMLIGDSGVEVAGPDPMERDARLVGRERVSSGVPALDHMLGGGYYRGTHVLVTGEPGTAKSALCGAFVEAACKRGERALYVGFDEGAGEMVRNLQSVNVDLTPHLASGLLRMRTAYAGVRGTEAHFLELKALIKEHEPTCVAIDPISAMLKAGGTVEAAGVAQRVVHQSEKRRCELQAARAEVKARMEALRHELEVKQAELEQLEADAGWRKRKRDEQEEEVRRRRRGQGQYAGYGEEE